MPSLEQPTAAQGTAAAAAPAPAAASTLQSRRAAVRAERLGQAQRQVDTGERFMSDTSDMLPGVRYRHASTLFVSAAETFRMYQVWRRAAEALSRASDAEKAMAQMLPCAVLASDSAELYSRVDANESARMYRAASGLHAALGRFITAGNLMVRTAELEEGDGARTSAAESYAAASQYYLAEDAYALCLAALARAGALHALEDSFAAAHALFERAARCALDDNLTRWHSPRLVLAAGLCLVAAARAPGAKPAEATALEARLELYQTVCAKRDGCFAGGRERRFLLDCADTSRIWAVHDFMDHAWNYDYVAQLTAHELHLLQAVHSAIEGGPPPDRARAAMPLADLNSMHSLEEEVQVEVEEMAPMSHSEMARSGLAKQLAEEAARDREEAERDAEAEYLLVHGISKAEQEKKDREDAQRG